MADDKSLSLVTSKEAAKFLGMSDSWLRRSRMISSTEEGPPFVRIGGAVRYVIRDLEAWVEAHRHAVGGLG